MAIVVVDRPLRVITGRRLPPPEFWWTVTRFHRRLLPRLVEPNWATESRTTLRAGCISDYGPWTAFAVKTVLNLLASSLSLPPAGAARQIGRIQTSHVRHGVLLDAARREGDTKCQALALRLLGRLLQNSPAVVGQVHFLRDPPNQHTNLLKQPG